MKKQMYYNGLIFSSVGNKIIINSKDKPERNRYYLSIKDLGLLNYCNLYNRLFRHGIHNFYKINSTIDCIVIKGKILFYKNKVLINEVKLEKGSRPLRNGIVYKDKYIIFSEYYGNKNREPVNIYKYDFFQNRKDILYTFNGIRHIHFIQQDKNDVNTLYIGTGDLDDECGIYKLNISKCIMEKLGGGSQIWRAVSLLQKNEDIYWGTDNPDGDNFIVKYCIKDDRLDKLQKIDGPAYYSTLTRKNEMFIATTIEDRIRHKAIIYKTVDGLKWDKYAEFKKDVFNTKFFGYGLIEFINNQEELDELIYNLNGLKL